MTRLNRILAIAAIGFGALTLMLMGTRANAGTFDKLKIEKVTTGTQYDIGKNLCVQTATSNLTAIDPAKDEVTLSAIEKAQTIEQFIALTLEPGATDVGRTTTELKQTGEKNYVDHLDPAEITASYDLRRNPDGGTVYRR